MMRKRMNHRAVRAAGFALVLGSGLLPLGGCNTGGGMPQQLEATKPRMDKEKETDHPVPSPGTAK
jgi:hypothetical protein